MTMIGNIATVMSTSACNPFMKHIYAESGGAASESQSEISSADSDWNDLKLIAAQLGVSNPDDLVTERFRIDRTKLVNLIKTETNDGGMNGAEQFFEEVIKETSTYIRWPCRLKLTAKTKKDPHVSIVGKPTNVFKAKERVIMALDPRGSRVIMKMDVSYTDHSYIIGRGGNNIRRIMEETATHIHFPDSNRLNEMEKSNQVSLCGSLDDVERARYLVRASSPIVILFEMPIVPTGHPIPDNSTSFVKEIEEAFGVQVIFSTRPKLHSSLILVKGAEREYLKVKEATKSLVKHIFENMTSPLSVQMQIEISTQHHYIVAGKNSDNLRAIMSSTGTEIMFPDAGDVNIRPIKRSQVTITGSIDGVYSARQQLIGNLPISLIFDSQKNIDSESIAKIMKTLDVFINIRQKTRQSSLCVVIKGIEKFIDKIYEARHQLLELNSPRTVANIPSTYSSKHDDNIGVNMLLSNPPNTPSTPITPGIDFVAQPWCFAMQTKLTNLRHQIAQNMNLLSPQPPGMAGPSSSSFCLGLPMQKYMQPNQGNYQNMQGTVSSTVNNSNTSQNSSGYQSFSSSSNSLEQSSISTTSYSNQTAFASPDTTTQFFSNYSSRSGGGDEPGRMTPNPPPGMSDYDRRKLFALKTLEVPPRGELRVPTPTWSGMSLSKTSPLSPSITNPNLKRESGMGVYNLGVTTSLIDSATHLQRMHISQCPDIHTLLMKLGMEHYIKNFVDNEVDLEVFQSFTDADLQTLGITTMGARRKLLLAIREMTANACRSPSILANQPQYSGSAAPGAERNPSKRW